MKKITRRQALGLSIGAGTALGLSACSSSSAPATAAGASGKPVSIPTGTIDEVFEGRRIQITLGAGGHHGMGVPTVKIDGTELHLMPNADGSWVSIVNHYETFPDPVSAARAAVRELQGATLARFAPKEVQL
ncbi:tyrosinase family oxidase copper chaperone [Streptomyces sp. G-G2]|uniref:apotyrosinase chaperone MelC1 n=1 Tax=Streptomyces sp. G-G2 TaxID=3046201 RepID=UPI0024BA0893|nr:tyrosinase family oxidase copper chaperone [Streptomyces sp. G-G2]MDJ0380425.1 tyrosinase family oxidase copper chaperone [Streptomyces sp. G-G2]